MNNFIALWRINDGDSTTSQNSEKKKTTSNVCNILLRNSNLRSEHGDQYARPCKLVRNSQKFSQDKIPKTISYISEEPPPFYQYKY